MRRSLTNRDGAGYLIRIHEPEVAGQTVGFSWRATPATDLYHRTHFHMTFPEEVAVERAPFGVWWRVALLCLHTHWALLRPCRVELPVTLEPGEREFWLRLAGSVAAQIDAYGGPRVHGGIELVGQGPLLSTPQLQNNGDRAAVCFSGGKDSLVLTGLASELTERPLLVSATSPVPWAPRDHVGAARDRARTETAARLGLETVNVHSDYRTSWDHGFSGRRGWWHGVHELSDLLLYQGAAFAVAAATGIGRILMASEGDIQYNTQIGGRLVLHPDPLSCAVSQRALDALFRGFGIRQGSLIYPIHMPQVQALLLRRYGHLADVQFSCWKAPEGVQACSACGKCAQIALVTLSEGFSPSRVGIDPVRVLLGPDVGWSLPSPGDRNRPTLHPRRDSSDHFIRCLQQMPTHRVASILEADPAARSDQRLGAALAAYARMRAQALARDAPLPPGYVPSFLELVAPEFRVPLRAIFDEYFDPLPEPEFEAMARRSLALSDWIGQPLSRSRPGRRASPTP